MHTTKGACLHVHSSICVYVCECVCTHYSRTLTGSGLKPVHTWMLAMSRIIYYTLQYPQRERT